MKLTSAVLAALAAHSSAHCVLTLVKGDNGVNMPGLSVQDDTPRDCTTPRCQSEVDTSVIRTREMGTSKASALGRTSSGPVDAEAAIRKYMGAGGSGTQGTAPKNNPQKRQPKGKKKKGKKGAGGALGGALGGGAGGAGGALGGLGGALGGGGGGGGGNTATGTKTLKGTVEKNVAKYQGQGADKGLPLSDKDGVITLSMHQVNQDGAGPLQAFVDPSSGGKDPNAFQEAKVLVNMPGLGFGGLSAAQTTDFDVKVQTPPGMKCTAAVGGATDVCIVMVKNSAAAGPFGGSGAYKLPPSVQKRAIEYNRLKRELEEAGSSDEE